MYICSTTIANPQDTDKDILFASITSDVEANKDRRDVRLLSSNISYVAFFCISHLASLSLWRGEGVPMVFA